MTAEARPLDRDGLREDADSGNPATSGTVADDASPTRQVEILADRLGLDLDHLLGARPRTVDRFEWERIVRRARIGPTRKLVALMAATYSDRDGSRVRPGVDLLAADTDKSTRTVKRALADLRSLCLLCPILRDADGKIVDDLAAPADHLRRIRAWAGKGRAAEYRLTVPDPMPDLLLRSPEHGPRVTRAESQQSPEHGPPMTREHGPSDTEHGPFRTGAWATGAPPPEQRPTTDQITDQTTDAPRRGEPQGTRAGGQRSAREHADAIRAELGLRRSDDAAELDTAASVIRDVFGLDVTEVESAP